MKQSDSSEAASHSASQEIHRLLMELESSFPCSQQPAAIGPYPEPDACSPHLPIAFP